MSFRFLIGIDEAGRGPLAGPLCVGACRLIREHAPAFFKGIRGLRDSKQLTEDERETWVSRLEALEHAGSCRLRTVFIHHAVIDMKGLAFALRASVARVLRKSGAPAEHSFVLLDGGLSAPSRFFFQETVINGDETDALIAAASIVAKVRRDRHMIALAPKYPGYGFEAHKGYGTPEHYNALRKYGPCAIHRKTFLRNLKIGEFEKVAVPDAQ